MSVGTLCVFCNLQLVKLVNTRVNTNGRSVIMDSFMSDVKKKLRQNEYKEVKSSGTSSVWTSFMQIVDKDNKKVSAVKCITCDALLKFDSAKTGTSHLLKHTRSCGKNVTMQTSVASFIRLGVVPKKAKDA